MEVAIKKHNTFRKKGAIGPSPSRCSHAPDQFYNSLTDETMAFYLYPCGSPGQGDVRLGFLLHGAVHVQQVFLVREGDGDAALDEVVALLASYLDDEVQALHTIDRGNQVDLPNSLQS